MSVTLYILLFNHIIPCVSSGNSYRYTIQPIFNNLTDSVKCHIRHRPTDVVYELFYYVEIPGRDFRTTRTRRVVTASRLQAPFSSSSSTGGRDSLRHRSRSAFSVDYLDVEHNTGLTLDDEFILERRGLSGSTSTDDGGGGKLFGTVTKLTSTVDDDDGDRRSGRRRRRKHRPTFGSGGGGGSAAEVGVVHEISAGAIYATSVTFDRPFEYSTSRWRRTASRSTERRGGNDRRKEPGDVDGGGVESDGEDGEDLACSDNDVTRFRPAYDDDDDDRSRISSAFEDQERESAFATSDSTVSVDGQSASRSVDTDEVQSIEVVVQGRRGQGGSGGGGTSDAGSRRRDPFVYFLKSTDNSPFIRFTVSGRCRRDSVWYGKVK